MAAPRRNAAQSTTARDTVQGTFPAATGGTLPRDPAGRHNRRNRQSRRNRGCRDSGVSGFRPGLSARGGAALVRDFAKTRPAAADAAARNPGAKNRKKAARLRRRPKTRNPDAGAAQARRIRQLANLQPAMRSGWGCLRVAPRLRVFPNAEIWPNAEVLPPLREASSSAPARGCFRNVAPSQRLSTQAKIIKSTFFSFDILLPSGN